VVKIETRHIVVDQSTCSGCRICELVCSEQHFGIFNPRRSAIRVIRNYGWSENWNTTFTCYQCMNSWCMQSCRFEAIYRDSRTGSVVVDYNRCKGCKKCEDSCPFDMIKIVEIDGEKKAFKCDLCNGEPVCVANCPTESIKIELVKFCGD